MRNFLRTRRGIAIAAIAVGAVAVGGVGAAVAAAAGSSAATTLYGCVTKTHTLVNASTTAQPGCPAGSTVFHVGLGARGLQGVQGLAGLAGKQGPAGPAGPAGAQGPAGPAGSDAILTVSAQTVVKNWPESSGWAIDAFTRNVTLTREGAVPASNCGSGATSCYLYSETLADNGGFMTVDGHLSPNAPTKATIKGAWAGTMTGGGKLEFYASSNSPNPSLVPGTADGSAKPSSTTSWYKLFFKSDTQYGLTSGPSALPWLTYDWEYSATVTCGTNATQSEHWSDSIPGDDGQGSGDGNITGATACAAA